MKFHLLGFMYWMSDREMRLPIDFQFKASNEQKAVKIAKETIRKLKTYYSSYYPDFTLKARLFSAKPIWRANFGGRKTKVLKRKRALRPEDFVKKPSTERLKEISHNIKIDALVNGTYYNKEVRR